MLAVVCPGQGAQSPGMLSPWLELPGSAATLAGYSEAAGTDLTRLGTTADAATIRDTAVAQPLIVATSLLSLGAVLDGADPAAVAGVTAGHSVGELAAVAIAGVLPAADALRLVGERGRAMAEAAAATPTGMSAVVGGDPDDVGVVLARHGLTPANVNGGGQVVAAGTLEQLAALAADPPARARVIPLEVAGAFHTEHMAPAVERVRAVAASLSPAQPRVALLSNADGAAVTDGADALARIVAQVARPVRWDRCCDTMLAMGVTGVLELAPGGVLTGLARRTLKGVEALALKSPDDLDAARDLVRRHGGLE
ncbi:ACP S-malonyltransferase [Georgenia faecalis]|uniref:[acyl-carrier-protein] S-malonyltransferase n=1 Tax=Georgenia faecalis TaxID=2483799 RepID=A0ABV9D9D7_9MICO|nr:ACP S-malonyltransferase [Georgenia faecalis]